MLSLLCRLAIASSFILPVLPGSSLINSLGTTAPEASQKIFIPAVIKAGQLPSQGAEIITSPRINLPNFAVSGGADSYFAQAAIFWFGQVGADSDYADVRVAGTNTELTVFVSVFDRLLWYSTQPSPSTLAQWDSATLYLSRSGNSGQNLGSDTYRFDSQFSWYESRANYQAAYRGNGNGFSPVQINFTTTAAYRGLGGPNTGKTERGWVTTFHIPYSSLGLSGRPADGTIWGIAMSVHNRNSNSGPPLADVSWPAGMAASKPASWAQLRFGIPTYTPLQKPVAGTTTIRNKLNGISVPDGNVGGTLANQCSGDEAFIWSGWGNAAWGNISADNQTGLNIQNQSNVDDWPCFSKYYITFPLGSLPTNKTILKATLVLHQVGGSGDVLGGHPPQPSYIQIFSLAQDFNPLTLTWNNGPQPLENVAGAWVDAVTNYDVPWPKYERDWDVTRAVAQAYAKNEPLRLAMYEGDSEFNSGKYFSTSETQDWNAAGRPTLIIQWGN